MKFIRDRYTIWGLGIEFAPRRRWGPWELRICLGPFSFGIAGSER